MTGPELDLEALLQRGFRYALALTHDRETARDVVQEACLRVVRSRASWRIGYLFRAIRSAWIDRARRQQSRLPDRTGDGATMLADENVMEPPAGLRDEALEAALLILRPEDRELLYLAVVEGYSASELARQVGSPRGTVLSRLHRAKLRLRELLAGRQFEVDA